ncbi:hypothetical protein MUN77_01705 [Leucobacter allii]|uniref:hypothetical protein n=1 Tax=Leucobacter allii TaxID=2932247 RepID=UPI001FD4B4DC|nr:hypothetical protein [Leucobacter allii]UOR02075.1 hypothetical protein MUN77_01705 [Leucobacter allii]
MTTTGDLREWYAANVEPRPSRFADEGKAYKLWSMRADRYMAWRADAAELSGAVEVPREPFQFAHINTALVGWTRTKSVSLNAGPWSVLPDGEPRWWFISLTSDGREFKIYQVADRAAALAWVEETCGRVVWEEWDA